MASAAALFAVTAICLAPRIVLAQSEAAPPAAKTQASPVAEPVHTTPAVASVAANFSPEASEAASSEAVLPVTPQPPAIGPGPKPKKSSSSAVTWQPAGLPVPLTQAVPAAPAALAAPSAPLMPQGAISLSAAPAPEPRPGRTPRFARAESADSALEERLERLEKMVESLMARGYATRNPFPMKPTPDTLGPIHRLEIPRIEADSKRQVEMALKHELDARAKLELEEQAKREAARAADLAKRAAVDAERIARAEQKRPTRLKELQLEGITGTPGRRIAVINNLTFTQGEEGEVRARNGRKIKIRVLEIRDKSVLLQIEGLAEPKELLLQEGSQRQLDDLRKRLESLEREREKLEHQIEELERNQEQLLEQQDENRDNDAQSDTSSETHPRPLPGGEQAESNSDSIQTPRQ
jgi:cell division protein FtsB